MPGEASTPSLSTVRHHHRPSRAATGPAGTSRRSITIQADGSGGYVLDGWGGLHPFTIGGTSPPNVADSLVPYLPGIDWARGIYFFAGPPVQYGLVLDGSGGLHPFGLLIHDPSGPSWPGSDLARGLSTGNHCHLEVDGFGGLHQYGFALYGV